MRNKRTYETVMKVTVFFVSRLGTVSYLYLVAIFLVKFIVRGGGDADKNCDKRIRPVAVASSFQTDVLPKRQGASTPARLWVEARYFVHVLESRSGGAAYG